VYRWYGGVYRWGCGREEVGLGSQVDAHQVEGSPPGAHRGREVDFVELCHRPLSTPALLVVSRRPSPYSGDEVRPIPHAQ